MSEDETAIRQLIKRWMAATRVGDTAAVLELMTDDVVFLVPGRVPFGKVEFEAAFRAMKDMEVDGTAEMVELHVSNDWAWIRNRISVSIRHRDAASVSKHGETLTIVRKDIDGNWRVARDANFVR